jgi:hypothetical protein
MTVYENVAQVYAASIEEAFTSEETLSKLHEKTFPGLPFDRTDRWHLILSRELLRCWNEQGPVVKAGITSVDRREILLHLSNLLDFNLFSQVLLNLQDWALLRYRVGDAQADTEKLQTKWAGKSPSPFDVKAKMVKAASRPEDMEFNRDLSTLKSLRIIPQIGPGLSFRVSPKGSTPALVDSANLSMLGIGGDQYLSVPPALNVAYLSWETAPTVVVPDEKGEFHNGTIMYPFVSKSGGDILNSVLATRLLATAAFKILTQSGGETTVVLPRMTSLMILTNASMIEVENLVDLTRQGWVTGSEPWPVELQWGRRAD